MLAQSNKTGNNDGILTLTLAALVLSIILGSLILFVSCDLVFYLSFCRPQVMKKFGPEILSTCPISSY